jgi:hypothetical protein
MFLLVRFRRSVGLAVVAAAGLMIVSVALSYWRARGYA